MDNAQIIKQFYQSFSNKDSQGMNLLYHDEVRFEDPAFGVLHGDEVRSMWKMLIERMNDEATITYSNVRTYQNKGRADWQATYTYGPNQRKVVNKIRAKFKFHNGKIVSHKDEFSMWNWSRQSLGLPGLLLGWTPFIKNKIQKKTRSLLKNYMKKN